MKVTIGGVAWMMTRHQYVCLMRYYRNLRAYVPRYEAREIIVSDLAMVDDYALGRAS